MLLLLTIWRYCYLWVSVSLTQITDAVDDLHAGVPILASAYIALYNENKHSYTRNTPGDDDAGKDKDKDEENHLLGAGNTRETFGEHVGDMQGTLRELHSAMKENISRSSATVVGGTRKWVKDLLSPYWRR
jgi:hypothetical protein